MEEVPLCKVSSQDCEFVRVLITKRIGTRMPNLVVEAAGDQLLVRGSTDSYYTLQLVLSALQSVLDPLSKRGCREVCVAVQVGNDRPGVRIACTNGRFDFGRGPRSSLPC